MTTTTHDSQAFGSALADALERIGPSIFHVVAGDRHASGVVLSAADHLLVTSSRLFHEQRDATIVLRGGDDIVRSGRLVGLDEATELALVKVQALDDAPLVAPEWTADARAVRVGQFVAPVARTASGLRATFGLVAHVGPAWVTGRGGSVDRYFDVEGTLPPGFSGGPLIDFGGRVLGIDTRGLVPGGATIPTATVLRVTSLLSAGGTTAPGHLGVAIQAVELPAHLQAGAPSGLLVTGVVPGSAADTAGIVPGDVLVAIAGHAVPDHAHLLAALAGKAGQAVTVRLARHGQVVEVEARAEARAERRQRGPGPRGQGEARHGHHGEPPWAPWVRSWLGKGCR